MTSFLSAVKTSVRGPAIGIRTAFKSLLRVLHVPP